MIDYTAAAKLVDDGALVTHPQFRGIYLRVVDLDFEEFEYETDSGDVDDAGSPIMVYDTDIRPSGQIIVRMVGDDRRHVVDPDDCTVVDEDATDICYRCGQTGCGWH